MSPDIESFERWRGEVTAKLDILSATLKVVAERQAHLSDIVCRQPCAAASTSKRVECIEETQRLTGLDIAAMKATARAWGAISGVLSGIAAALLSKLWH